MKNLRYAASVGKCCAVHSCTRICHRHTSNGSDWHTRSDEDKRERKPKNRLPAARMKGLKSLRPTVK